MKTPRSARVGRGPLAWMVHNRVTPNLLMIFLLVGGIFMTSRIKQEVFPDFELDIVTVRVPYPGAGPEEVERGIVLAIEEAIRGIEGVKELTAVAGEGMGSVTAELHEGIDRQKTWLDIRQAVERITTFPRDAEDPQVNLANRRREVLIVQLHGPVSEAVLRETAEDVRDRLLQSPDITQIDLAGAREFEIHVEVPRERLRMYGLTLADIARTISALSAEIPGGALKTPGGDVLLRIKDRRDWAREFARLPVVITADGSAVTLGDIAVVREGFEDSDRYASWNGRRSIGLDVFRVGEQSPIGVSEAVRAAMAEIGADLPPGIEWDISRDSSEVYQQRLQLLLKNAFIGLILVLAVLGLFLEFKLAFWVTMGIPISFLGGLLFLPFFGVSLNMVSLFAFIIALGIVVDDAIIAGENIYEYRQRGMSFVQAAIQGARDVSTPIAFAILTNVVAFLPISFMPGIMGKIWASIPLVVITVFLVSWVESLLILPAHLAHTRSKPRSRITARLHELQQRFARRFSRFVEEVYGPFLVLCLRWRGLAVAIGAAVLVVVLSYAFSGRMGMMLMPRVESDQAVVTAVLPVGSPTERVAGVEKRLLDGMRMVAAEHGGDDLLRGIFSEIRNNEVLITAYLTPPGVRPLSTGEVTRLWREQTGQLAGLESLRFQSDRGGPGGGAALTVELSHRDVEVLERAAVALGERMADFPNVKDVDSGFTPGKDQLDFRLKAEGQSLGLTADEVARQVRNAFSGVEALRQQRGRNEITVRVRLPESERTSEFDIENLMVRTPAGTYVPLTEVADVARGRAYTAINRRDARRTMTVSADVEPIAESNLVITALNSSVLPDLAADFPGLTYGYEGRQATMRDSLRSLFKGFGLSLAAIFFLLAIPFRSYTQPLIVMTAIPFGAVGAILGHLLMGYSLSLISMMGMLALAGVVVNDSLVLIDYANRRRREGATALEAITLAGKRRFRPILLTTLTTFGGLAPMIFETSRQARFMIPMAISLGYGILFATLVILILVPCFYLLLEDVSDFIKSGADTEEEATPGRIVS